MDFQCSSLWLKRSPFFILSGKIRGRFASARRKVDTARHQTQTVDRNAREYRHLHRHQAIREGSRASIREKTETIQMKCICFFDEVFISIHRFRLTLYNYLVYS